MATRAIFTKSYDFNERMVFFCKLSVLITNIYLAWTLQLSRKLDDDGISLAEIVLRLAVFEKREIIYFETSIHWFCGYYWVVFVCSKMTRNIVKDFLIVFCLQDLELEYI
jgi:hypothetical protein